MLSSAVNGVGLQTLAKLIVFGKDFPYMSMVEKTIIKGTKKVIINGISKFDDAYRSEERHKISKPNRVKKQEKRNFFLGKFKFSK
jgi:hypothetical protein